MKLCSKCKKKKPVSEFYKHSRNKDGLYSHCRQCHSDYYYKRKPEIVKTQKAYYRKNRQKIIDKVSGYYRDNLDKKRRYDREYVKTKRGKRVRKRAAARYNQTKDGELKRKARTAVNNAVKLGHLASISTRKCRVCHEQAHHYHHHRGYAEDFWLDVAPLCRKHHKD